MIQNLPPWNFNNLKPSFNDLESATAVEMVYKLYGKNQELINDYNQFLTDINNEVTAFKESTNQDMECFKENITKICNDYIATMDMKIDCQDRKIADAIAFMRDNLQTSINELLTDMQEQGELNTIILNTFNSLDRRLSKLEKIIPSYEYTSETLKINNIGGVN